MNGRTVPRLLTAAVQRAATVMPVVVVSGARQTGKSTLVRDLLPGKRAFYTLDDIDVRAQAQRSPHDLVHRAERLVLDEVQRVPDILLAVKKAVDESRRPGQFVLTGSANLLMMQRVSESLAGRAAYLALQPLTRREQNGVPAAGMWAQLFETALTEWPDLLASNIGDAAAWTEYAMRGGYPVPALELKSTDERAIWFAGYVQTYLERDLRDLASIDNLVDFRRLMAAAAQRTGQLINQTELGRDVQLPQPTVHRWLNLLETSYQLVRLPAYSVNRTRRLIKTPKLYWSDTGLAIHLADESEPRGQDLENLVLIDILAWRGAAAAHPPAVFYWRTASGDEIDLVVEWKKQLIGIEVKATRRPTAAHARHLKSFRDEYGKRVRGCLLLHTGSEISWLADGVLSVPWSHIV